MLPSMTKNPYEMLTERAQIHRKSTESRASHHLRRAGTSSKDIDELKIDLTSVGKQSETGKTGNPDQEATGWRKHLKIVLPHVILVVSTLMYMILGATIFYWIERPHEESLKNKSAKTVRELQRQFLENTWTLSEQQGRTEDERDWMEQTGQQLDEVIEATFDAFIDGLTAQEIEDQKIKLEWTFLSSVLFTTTVITTVGYGHLVPVTFWGRVFCVVYALFGIPLALITIADLGKFASIVIVVMYKRLMKFNQKIYSTLCFCCSKKSGEEANNNLIDVKNKEKNKTKSSFDSNDTPTALSTTTVSGFFVLFILLGYTAICAKTITFWEGWSFYDAFYFYFITMVTVGFGDIVPTKESYHIVAVIFIFIGLVLTTMSIDLVGTGYIERIHYFGRRLQFAKDALALLGGKAVNMQEWLKQHQNVQGDSHLRLMMMPNNYVNILQSDRWFAFVPKDAPLINYIDQIGSTTTEDHSSIEL